MSTAAVPAAPEKALDPVEYADPADFSGKTIAIETGSTAQILQPEILPDARPLYFSSASDCVVAVMTGKADASFTDELIIKVAGKNDPDLKILLLDAPGGPVAPVFRLSESGRKLAEQYNAFLAEWKANGKLEALTKKWTEDPELAHPFDDPSELPAINGTLKIATQAGYPPFQFVADGEITGYEVELMREFCRTYGYRAEFSNMDFDAVLMSVVTGKCDIGSSGLTITEERSKNVLFGDSFYTNRPVLCVKTTGGQAAGAGGGGNTGKSDTYHNGGFLNALKEGLERTFLTESRWKLFASGLGMTCLITLLSVFFGVAFGFGLYLLCRGGAPVPVRITAFCKWFITGMPEVVFLMILFYIVFVSTSVSGPAVAVVGFTTLFGFSVFDMLKNGEAAVEEGQKEAAYSLGYGNFAAYWRIILPQAIRHILPVFEGAVSSLLKATAVVGYVAVVDLTKVGDLIRGRTYDAVFPLLAVVIGYFLLAGIFKAVIRYIGKKTDPAQRKKEDILKGAVIRAS